MKLSPTAVCLTRTCPGPGVGSGIDSNRSCSGPPTSCRTIAFGMCGVYLIGGRRSLRSLWSPAPPLATRGEATLRSYRGKSGEAEEGAQLDGDAAAVLGAAGGDEYRVVARQSPHHLGEVRLVEGAGHGASGAGLGPDHDQRAVGVDSVDQAPHRIEWEGAAAGLDQVPR